MPNGGPVSERTPIRSGNSLDAEDYQVVARPIAGFAPPGPLLAPAGP
jgi:hypothetical protein